MNNKNIKALMSDFAIYDKQSDWVIDYCDDGQFPVIYQLFAEIELITTDIQVWKVSEKRCQLVFDYEQGESVTKEQEAQIDQLIQSAATKFHQQRTQ